MTEPLPDMLARLRGDMLYYPEAGLKHTSFAVADIRRLLDIAEAPPGRDAAVAMWASNAWRGERDALRARLAEIEAERDALHARLADVEAERDALLARLTRARAGVRRRFERGEV